MKLSIRILIAATILFAWGQARADIGWSEQEYTKAYGQGQRGFGKANEKGYPLDGGNHLVVEFSPDNSHSIGELWVLGPVRDNIPDRVKSAAAAAEKAPEVEHVTFSSHSSLPAEIHEIVIDDNVIRVDMRNQVVFRVAFCGPKPSCSWWRRLFGPKCDMRVSCPVLERALAVDHTMDDLHKRAEEAAERINPHAN